MPATFEPERMEIDKSKLGEKAQAAKETTKDAAQKVGAAAKGAIEGFREASERTDLKGEAKRGGQWARETRDTVLPEVGRQMRETKEVVKDPEGAQE